MGAYPLPSSVVGASDSSEGPNESPLEVLPISVWSPTSRGTAPFPTVPDEVTGNRDCSEIIGMRTLCFLMQSSPPGLFPPSCAIPTSGGWAPCPSRRLWLFFFREPPLYVRVLSSIFFFIVSIRVAESLSFFFF